MPSGFIKNSIYALALPFFGKKCEWQSDDEIISKLYHKAHAVGACYQEFRHGELSEAKCYGYANLQNKRPVTAQTLFRTASLTKTVIALLVFRLQTIGLLSVKEDISDLWHQTIRNPAWPNDRITIGMLLSHTSGIVDSNLYYRSYIEKISLDELMRAKESFSTAKPGSAFQYSNLGAGMIACLLEKRFQKSIETMLQEYLLFPLQINGTLDITKLNAECLADDWRVLPASIGFSAEKRIEAAKSVSVPDEQSHYLLAAGGFMVSAPMLAKLSLLIADGGNGFLDKKSLSMLKTPVANWPDCGESLKHAMGVFQMGNSSVYGHQGFAYGAVNGLFVDNHGDGFVSLTNGASEQRNGHLSVLNEQLCKAFFKEKQ